MTDPSAGADFNPLLPVNPDYSLPADVIDDGMGGYMKMINGSLVSTDAFGTPLSAAKTNKATYGISGLTVGPQGEGYYYLDGPNGTPGTYAYGPPPKSGGSTTVVNASTGGAHYTTMYGPDGYGTYETSSGTPILVGTKQPTGGVQESYPGSGVTDAGVSIYAIPSSKSPTGYVVANGTPVNPDGSPYTGAAPENLHYFSSGGIEYAYDPATGKTSTIGGHPTGSAAGTGGTARVTNLSGGGGGGGSSSASEAAILQAQSNAADLAEKAREFGITDQRLLAQLKQNADQFGMDYALRQAAQQQQQAKDEKAAQQQRAETTAKYVANPQDVIARDYWLHSGREPTGTPVSIFSGQAAGPPTTASAVNDVQSMQAMGGLASSAPPSGVATLPAPPAQVVPPPPAFRRGTDRPVQAGYTTAPAAKVGERGTEMMMNPTHAPIRILNHQQVRGRQPVPPPMMPPPPMMRQPMPPSQGFATGTDQTAPNANLYGGAVATPTQQAASSYGWLPSYLSTPTPDTPTPTAPSIYGTPPLATGGTYSDTYTPGAMWSGTQWMADPNAANAGGGTGFDVGAGLGLNLTAGQRSALAEQAAATYEQGQLGDLRTPTITAGQVNSVLGTPTPPPAAAGQPITGSTPSMPLTNLNQIPLNTATGGVQGAKVQPTPPPATTQAATPAQVYSLPGGAQTFNGGMPVPLYGRGAMTAQEAQAQQASQQGSPLVAPPPPAATPATPATPATNGSPAAPATPATPPPGNYGSGPTGIPAAPPPATPPVAAPPPGPAAISYDPSVYANLPSLKYLQGLMDPQDFANITGNPSGAGGLGGALPAPNQLNYGYLQNLKQTDPTGWAAMQAIWKARNRDIDQEMNYALQRAPVGNAQNTDTIST